MFRDEKKIVSNEEIKLACLVLTTADYCQTTAQQLGEKIKEGTIKKLYVK